MMLLFTYQSFAEDLANTIQVEAQKCANGIVKSDFESIFYYTHPIVLKMNGGKDQMKAIIQNGMAEMEKGGSKIVSVDIGLPTQIKTINNKIYSIVPQKIHINVKGGYLIQNSYLLGVSDINSEKWHFIDTAPLTNENIGFIFPDIQNQVIIPEKSQPTFFQN